MCKLAKSEALGQENHVRGGVAFVDISYMSIKFDFRVFFVIFLEKVKMAVKTEKLNLHIFLSDKGNTSSMCWLFNFCFLLY